MKSLRRRWDDLAFSSRMLALAGYERARTGILFNPLREDLRSDPYPFYRELRERDPVHRSWAADGWVLSRYEDVLAVLSDRGFSADERNWSLYSKMRARSSRAGLPDPYADGGGWMLRRDPPDHTRLRGLVNKAFTPRSVDRMRGRVLEIVHERLAPLGPHGRMELIDAVAAPIPVVVIAEMLGVPAEDHALFRRLSDRAVQTLGDGPLERVLDARDALEELGRYIEGVCDQRRQEPRNDLISAMLAAEEAGEKLSLPELVSTCILLLVAGNETTTSLIANSVVALLRNPEQLALLRDEPKRIEGAVEELLRYDGPVQLTSRMVLEDTELAGRRLRRGQQIVLLLASANRDPEVFEDPERLDVTRDDVRHLAFSRGTHFCLGAQLARLEASLTLEALLTRMPQLRFAGPDRESIRWGSNTVLRGPTAVYLEY